MFRRKTTLTDWLTDWLWLPEQREREGWCGGGPGESSYPGWLLSTVPLHCQAAAGPVRSVYSAAHREGRRGSIFCNIFRQNTDNVCISMKHAMFCLNQFWLNRHAANVIQWSEERSEVINQRKHFKYQAFNQALQLGWTEQSDDMLMCFAM